MNWRLINDDAQSGAQNGAQNMATDEALLWNMREGDAPILRFYRWNPSCLSLGRFQKSDDFSVGNEVDLVRRPTGGRAVWHQHEITYSFVLHEELFPPNACSVVETYRRISEGFLEGLRLLGIGAAIAPGEKAAISSTRSRGLTSPNCFQSATRADFVVDGRKLLGAAQCRKNGAILQHGSLLLDVDENLWTRYAGGSMKNVVTVKSLGIENSREEIIGALCKGVAHSWKTSLVDSMLTARENAMATFLLERKYRIEDWNWDGVEPSSVEPDPRIAAMFRRDKVREK